MLGRYLRYSLFTLILLSMALDLRTPASGVEAAAARGPICLTCLRIRVGLPLVEQGPAGNVADNNFSEIQIPGGRFRGFTAAAETYAIDGNTPLDMSDAMRKVLGRGAPGSYDSCGQWIQHAEVSGSTTIGWVHDETACNYAKGQTHMATSIAMSNDYGLTWKDQGRILTDNDVPTPNKNTGEGGCTVVNGKDGYFYAYCYRNKDGQEIVSRAPVSDPGPGRWLKYFQGKWDQPGLGGDATGLAKGTGGNAARWETTGETLLLGWVTGGMGVRFSTDHLTFNTMPEPLMDLDPGSWNRPAASELLSYPVLLDAKAGGNQLSNAWMLAYMYIQPDESFDRRYLVLRTIDVTVASAPLRPQVGILLARWYNAGAHDHWSTTAPVPPLNGSPYKLEAKSGYLMTLADPGKPSVELEDCVSSWPGHPDHMLDRKGVCEADSLHFKRLRTAGWVYAQSQPRTEPLYRCYNAQEHSHFASNAEDCEKAGTKEKLLGYALSQ
jgi:hypothetical protein